MNFRSTRPSVSRVKRILGSGSALLPLLAMLAMLAPPPAHSHGAHGHVPVADSEPCAGGGVHLHAAHTHAPGHCPACAAGPTPAAAPPAAAGVTVPDGHVPETGDLEASFLSPASAPRRSRAPPAAFA